MSVGVILERWLAVASLGLFVLFAGLMLSLYNFMVSVPSELGLAEFFEADPKLLQFISIGAAPGFVLTGVSFILSKTYGSKQVGALICASGAALLAGMYACYTLTDQIGEAYITTMVVYVPAIFMALSAPVLASGAYLMRHRKRRPKKEYF